MKYLLYSILLTLTLLSCKKDVIEGAKYVNIHVETENQVPIEGIRFWIEYFAPVVVGMKAEGVTDVYGNCTLIFDYKDHVGYSLEIDETNTPVVTSYGKMDKFYKVKGSIPDLNFSRQTNFDVNVTLIQTGRLQMYFSDISGQTEDLIDLQVYVSYKEIINKQFLKEDTLSRFSVYADTSDLIRIYYKVYRNSNLYTVKEGYYKVNNVSEDKVVELMYE